MLIAWLQVVMIMDIRRGTFAFVLFYNDECGDFLGPGTIAALILYSLPSIPNTFPSLDINAHSALLAFYQSTREYTGFQTLLQE